MDLLNFFLKIIRFHTNQIVRIDTTPPLRKIVTFSHEVGLDIYTKDEDGHENLWSGGAG